MEIRATLSMVYPIRNLKTFKLNLDFDIFNHGFCEVLSSGLAPHINC